MKGIEIAELVATSTMDHAQSASTGLNASKQANAERHGFRLRLPSLADPLRSKDTTFACLSFRGCVITLNLIVKHMIASTS